MRDCRLPATRPIKDKVFFAAYRGDYRSLCRNQFFCWSKALTPSDKKTDRHSHFYLFFRQNGMRGILFGRNPLQAIKCTWTVLIQAKVDKNIRRIYYSRYKHQANRALQNFAVFV